MEENWSVLLGGRRRIKVDKGMDLRLLSALELLEAGREAEQLACREEEKALCANACLLARALERDGKPVFSDGEAVLRGLSAGEIGAMAKLWNGLNRTENPSPEDGEERVDALKKALSTRLRRVFAGVCSKHSGHSPLRREQRK